MRILYQYQVTISSKIRYDFFENGFVLNMELNVWTAHTHAINSYSISFLIHKLC